MTTKRSLRPLRDDLRDLSLPSGRENRENRAWVANRGKAWKSPEVRRQGSQPRLWNFWTSTIYNITERSISDVWVLRSVKNGVSTLFQFSYSIICYKSLHFATFNFCKKECKHIVCSLGKQFVVLLLFVVDHFILGDRRPYFESTVERTNLS